MSALEHPVATLRRRKGLAIHQLATEAGVSVGAISMIESGATRNPNTVTLEHLARALDVPLPSLELAIAEYKVALATVGASS